MVETITTKSETDGGICLCISILSLPFLVFVERGWPSGDIIFEPAEWENKLEFLLPDVEGVVAEFLDFQTTQTFLN